MLHYQRPDWFTKHVFNRFVALCTGLGISVWGSRVLRVRGRKQSFRAVEISDEQKVPILRDYLKRWSFEVGIFFGGSAPGPQTPSCAG